MGFFGRKPFQPCVHILMQAGFVVVDKDALAVMCMAFTRAGALPDATFADNIPAG